MKQNKLSWKLLKFELVNQTSNIFVIIFGVVFPIGMVLLFAAMFGKEAPDPSEVYTQLFLQMAMIIPLASVFMGHAANYAGELESGAVTRFKLFGFKERSMVAAKLIANLIFLTCSLALYALVIGLALDIQAPAFLAVVLFVLFFYVYAIILFVLSHAVATLCGTFGRTFGVVMGLYFLFMILGGNMGLQPSQMPAGLRHLSMATPLYYMSTYFQNFWIGGAFVNFIWLIVTTAALAFISFGLIWLAVWLTKKGKIKQGEKAVYYD